jgi:hypothetical protein
MSGLPIWAAWSIVVPLILLSPIIAFLLALAAEIVVCAFVDAGVPIWAMLSAVTAALILWRLARRAAPGRPAVSSESP